MVPLGPSRLLLVIAAAALGGAVNAIAGGGTLLTFPALVALGIPPIVANATSTVALWPGAVSSWWGYRALLAGMRDWVVRFAAPSVPLHVVHLFCAGFGFAWAWIETRLGV